MTLTIAGPEGLNTIIEKSGRYYIIRKHLITLFSDTENPPSAAESLAILAIGHGSVSRRHLQLDISNHIILTDLNSKYGSFLDGNRFEQTELNEARMYRLQLGNLVLNVFYEK